MINCNLLALDLATTTGWAVRTLDGKTYSGTWDLANGKLDSDGMRFLYLKRKLAWVENRFGTIGLICHEDVMRHVSHKARIAYFGYLTHLMSWVAGHDNPPPIIGYGVGTIKKFATGRGGWKGDQKQPMIDAAQKRGWVFADDNEVDALWLLHLCVQDVEKGTNHEQRTIRPVRKRTGSGLGAKK